LETHHYELGQKILSFIDVDLQQLITEVITELQPLVMEKEIELQSILDLRVPAIQGDRLELRRVITNLIGNAIKFTDRGTVKVSLSQNKSTVLMEIADTGIGIPPQDQQTIFQRYHQGNHRRSGKGLGLYLCQQIINAHQGQILVNSEVDVGTTFIIALPVTLRYSHSN
jgi:two-component system, sensor histidine kinase and response regulator